MPFFFLNLSAAEFLVLLGAFGGAITALYFLDRRKRTKVVATLRFWSSADQSETKRSRRRLQQPWSLLLQLVSLLLILLAIAQVQWGDRPVQARDHVVLVDTSSWSAARLDRDSTVLQREKTLARAYIEALPANDRVLLVSANTLAAPAGQFTADRALLVTELQAMQSGFSGLHLRGALAFATGAQRLSPNVPGEIVYTGPGFTSDSSEAGEPAKPPRNLRLLEVPVRGADLGIASLTVTPEPGNAGERRAHLTLRNTGNTEQRVLVRAAVGNKQFAPRLVDVSAKSEVAVEYRFAMVAAGTFSAVLGRSGIAPDSLPLDDAASLPLPALSPYRLIAFTRRPGRLRVLLESNPNLSIQYLAPEKYSRQIPADLVLLDGFVPAETPAIPALFLMPPVENAHVKVKSIANGLTVKSWNIDLLGESGLHSQEMVLAESDVFATDAGVQSVATTDRGAVAVAHDAKGGGPRWFAIGFDVASDPARLDLTTPLLMANALHWLTPDAFRSMEYAALPIGTIQIPLEAGETEDRIRVTTESGVALPFTVRHQMAEFFVARPETVELASTNRRLRLTAALADVPETQWIPPPGAVKDLPGSAVLRSGSLDLWRWFAILGGLGLLLEWLLFGRSRRSLRVAASLTGSRARTKERVSA